MLWLKQSTVVVINFGPFVDPTDGITPVITLVAGLDNGTTGIMLSKNGGALAVRAATVTATTYDALGCYLVTLKAGDTNTLGTLRMIYADPATCLAVWLDLMVVPDNVWTSMFGTTKLMVDMDSIKTQAVTCGAGVTVLASVGTAATSTAQTGDSYALVNGTSGVAAIKGDTAAILLDTGTDGVVVAAASKTGYALSAAGIQAIWDALSAALTTVNSIGKRLVDYLTGDAYARLGAPAGASVSADIAAVKVDTAAVPTAVQNADALLKRDMSAVTGASARSPLNALRPLRNKVWVDKDDRRMHVFEEDDMTEAWAADVITDAGLNPITSIDPT